MADPRMDILAEILGAVPNEMTPKMRKNGKYMESTGRKADNLPMPPSRDQGVPEQVLNHILGQGGGMAKGGRSDIPEQMGKGHWSREDFAKTDNGLMEGSEFEQNDKGKAGQYGWDYDTLANVLDRVGLDIDTIPEEGQIELMNQLEEEGANSEDEAITIIEHAMDIAAGTIDKRGTGKGPSMYPDEAPGEGSPDYFRDQLLNLIMSGGEGAGEFTPEMVKGMSPEELMRVGPDWVGTSPKTRSNRWAEKKPKGRIDRGMARDDYESEGARKTGRMDEEGNTAAMILEKLLGKR